MEVVSTRPDAARWAAALPQGMRQAECLGLRWSSIDWDADTITVSHQVVTLFYLDRKAGTFRIPDDYEVTPIIGSYHPAEPGTAAGERTIRWCRGRTALERCRDIAPVNEWDLVWTHHAAPHDCQQRQPDGPEGVLPSHLKPSLPYRAIPMRNPLNGRR